MLPPPPPPPRKGEGSLILHPTTREPAGDLPALLARAGVSARSLPLYETIETHPPPPPHADAILIHSPNAARAVVRLLRDSDPSAHDALCISDAAAAPLRALNFRRIAVARFPNDAALLKLLEN